MDRNYKQISENILRNRDRYYKKRKRIINSFIYSIIPLFVVSVSLLLLPPKNKIEEPNAEYRYVYMAVEVSQSTRYDNFVINDLSLINEVMNCIDESRNSTSDDLPEKGNGQESAGDEIDDEILPNTDYLLRVTDKDGNNLIIIVTRNYILRDNGKAYFITEERFNYIDSLIENK